MYTSRTVSASDSAGFLRFTASQGPLALRYVILGRSWPHPLVSDTKFGPIQTVPRFKIGNCLEK